MVVNLAELRALDLFAGPGGWDYAAHVLGFAPLGFEWDDAACATREAVGLRTIQADIASVDPLEHGPCDLLIASPPCPSFSRAGLRAGIDDLPMVYAVARALAAGGQVPEVECKDERSALVTEPLRWALALQPRWLAWEQVPDVLPFWELCAELLREQGWNVWTGIVEAERYGVAQTRERAILLADRDRPVGPPPPTHQRYVKGEPQRHEVTLEGEILPWVSMAEALGWDQEDEIGFPRRADGEEEGEYRERDRRPASEPSFALGEKARSWDRVQTDNVTDNGERKYERSIDDPAPTLTTRVDRWSLQNGNRENAAERDGDEPAPTLHFGGRCNKVDWVKQARDSGPAAEREPRDADEPSYTVRAQGSGSHPSGVKWVHDRPAPTIVTTRRSSAGILVGRQLPDGEGQNVGGWGWERSATTVAGDPRIFAPGRADRDPDYQPGGDPVSQNGSGTAVRVSLEEAAVLQSFPPNYPFQGTRSKQFEQVGNAVPPLLAHAILQELLG